MDVMRSRTEARREETAITGMSKVAHYRWRDPKEPGKFELLDKDIIQIDHENYQRNFDPEKVLAIARDFNWPAFGCLVIAQREDAYYVVVGQHRLLGARKRVEIRKVPCMVFISEGPVQEAQTFLDTATLLKPLTAVDKFKARIRTGEPTAIAVRDMVESKGRVVAKHPSGGTVSCIAAMSRLYDAWPDELTSVWNLVNEVCSGEAIPDSLLEAIVFIERRMPTGTSLNDRKWRTRLLEAGYDVIMRDIRAAAQWKAGGGAKVWAIGVRKLLNKGLAEKNRIPVEPGDED